VVFENMVGIIKIAKGVKVHGPAKEIWVAPHNKVV
jgi:hypothetical protein